jgi:hypothetical protein
MHCDFPSKNDKFVLIEFYTSGPIVIHNLQVKGSIRNWRSWNNRSVDSPFFPITKSYYAPGCLQGLGTKKGSLMEGQFEYSVQALW